jgi:hypothetical protein
MEEFFLKIKEKLRWVLSIIAVLIILAGSAFLGYKLLSNYIKRKVDKRCGEILNQKVEDLEVQLKEKTKIIDSLNLEIYELVVYQEVIGKEYESYVNSIINSYESESVMYTNVGADSLIVLLSRRLSEKDSIR